MINKQFKFEAKPLKISKPLKIKVKVTKYQKLVRDLYVTKTKFKFEGKIPNDSKVIMFTRNHTDNDDGTQNNTSPPVGWERG